MSIKAIETKYNGYRFRSRLEARWAVFFDTLGIKYEYEKEGFDLNGTWYLPDFWLPDLECWAEIKGQRLPTKEEQTKLATLTGKDNRWIGIILSETPDAIDNEGYAYFWGKCIGFQAFIQCKHCETVGMIMYNPPGIAAFKKEFYALEPGEKFVPPLFFWRLRCECRKKYGDGKQLVGVSTDTPRLIAAYTAARQARFEHGR